MTTDDKPLVLEVQNVTKRFGPVTALSDVNVQLRAGEVLGLIGDNGAGKSTLVNILCGALRADEGRCSSTGLNVTSPIHPTPEPPGSRRSSRILR